MKLGVIGCGKMGTALVQGAIRGGVVKSGEVLGVDSAAAARESFAKLTGAETTASIVDALEGSEVLLLCTKPQDVFSALGSCKLDSGAGKLMISIAAGVTLANLEKHTPANMRVVRTMPNTPALVGKGAAAYCMGSRCVAGDEDVVKALLGAVGMAVSVPEKLMDAVTGLSGSGPAYVYLIIEALADGGVRAGLPRADAMRLAAQTVSGAAEMVIQTGEHPAVLKDMVTSPGGTTIAGLSVLEEKNVRSALIEAVMMASRRSAELGKG
ncbi:MAG: pyrroline-5-carboxylate reductase [Armatimonadetes bacterium]|nr:pyrroline-5-carboxylate reductase [Akkermansiaceae bacterium]